MTYEAAPNYYQPQPSRAGSGMAIAALVLGVLAVLSSWTVIGGILLGLVAIILGFIALSRAKRGQGGGKAMAIIGIIAGALGMVLSIVLISIGLSFLNSDTGKNLQECLQKAGNDEAAQTKCQREFEDDLQG